MARARLRDRHQDNLKAKLELLKREQDEIIVKKEESDYDEASMSEHSNSPKPGTSKDPMPSTSKAISDVDESSQTSSHHSEREQEAQVDLLQECFKLYEKGNYSPKYIKLTDIEPDKEVISE